MSAGGSSDAPGFTLIELLIAALVLAVGLLTLSALIHGLGLRDRRSERIMDLDLRARSQVESLRIAGYSGTAVGRTVGAGSEILVWDDTLGLREITVIARDSAAGVARADTLVTRLGRR